MIHLCKICNFYMCVYIYIYLFSFLCCFCFDLGEAPKDLVVYLEDIIGLESGFCFSRVCVCFFFSMVFASLETSFVYIWIVETQGSFFSKRNSSCSNIHCFVDLKVKAGICFTGWITIFIHNSIIYSYGWPTPVTVGLLLL